MNSYIHQAEDINGFKFTKEEYEQELQRMKEKKEQRLKMLEERERDQKKKIYLSDGESGAEK